MPPNGDIRSRARTTSDEIVPTSQYDEVELHMPEISRADDGLWLIGMERTGKNAIRSSQREQLVKSPKARKNPGDGNEGIPSCVDISNTGPHIGEDGSAFSAGARLESPSFSRYATHNL